MRTHRSPFGNLFVTFFDGFGHSFAYPLLPPPFCGRVNFLCSPAQGLSNNVEIRLDIFDNFGSFFGHGENNSDHLPPPHNCKKNALKTCHAMGGLYKDLYRQHDIRSQNMAYDPPPLCHMKRFVGGGGGLLFADIATFRWPFSQCPTSLGCQHPSPNVKSPLQI